MVINFNEMCKAFQMNEYKKFRFCMFGYNFNRIYPVEIIRAQTFQNKEFTKLNILLDNKFTIDITKKDSYFFAESQDSFFTGYAPNEKEKEELRKVGGVELSNRLKTFIEMNGWVLHPFSERFLNNIRYKDFVENYLFYKYAKKRKSGILYIENSINLDGEKTCNFNKLNLFEFAISHVIYTSQMYSENSISKEQFLTFLKGKQVPKSEQEIFNGKEYKQFPI
jgi:hypothetical protein